MNEKKPEFKAPQLKSTIQQRYKYETKFVATTGTGSEVADRIQKKLDSASDAGFKLAAMHPLSSEVVLVFEKGVSK